MVDLTSLLGASKAPATQVLTLYIPDKDRNGKQIKNLSKWIREAQDVLTAIGGGSTSTSANGTWMNPESGVIIREKTVIVYTYINADSFKKNFRRLREFVHRFGKETNQGEVAVLFAGMFYLVQKYD